MKKASEVLRKAAGILKNYGWCQGFWAYDSDGTKVMADHSGAVTFCSLGAIGKALQYHDVKFRDTSCSPWAYLEREVGTIAIWNDEEGRTKEEVLKAFEAAATAAEEKGR